MARERVQAIVESWPDSCAAEITVAVLGGAWKPTILSNLASAGTLRFGELRKSLGELSPRVLTRQLRELEEDGLITRTVYAEVPPRVEYRLSERGTAAQPILQAMIHWGREYAEAEHP